MGLLGKILTVVVILSILAGIYTFLGEEYLFGMITIVIVFVILYAIYRVIKWLANRESSGGSSDSGYLSGIFTD